MSPTSPLTTPGGPPTTPGARPRDDQPTGRHEILRAGRLGGLAPGELAERFGTPLYAYDLDAIDAQVAALRAALPARAELAYAVKANPALAIVAHLGRLGLGADVASGGELATALRAGIEPERIVMTGPGKRDVELASAVRVGIRAVTVESPGELERLERIAADIGRRQPVMLRAATTESGRHERVRLVGDAGAGKFGMDAASLREAAGRASRSPYLDLLGLHAFGASNVLDASVLVDHVAETGRRARWMAELTGIPVRIVDAGGGLGIPYAEDDGALDLDLLARGLAAAMDEWSTDPLLAGAHLLLEPGRFLVGPAGAYLARVVDAKTVDGRAVAILDGGVHHVLRPALVRLEHRIAAFAASGGGATRDPEPVTLAGPLCSGLDVLARGVVIQPPAVGDLVAVLDVGAYGFTESMPLFLSHPIPAEVVVRDGRAELIRPRLDPGEWLDRQLVPDLVGGP